MSDERWSHRNHEEAIKNRQQVLRGLPQWRSQDERIFNWHVDPSQLSSYLESLTGQMVMPVSIVGPYGIDMGEYQWIDGTLTETSRHKDEVYIPLAHTEGGLSMSMQRGIHALNRSGGIKTYVLNDMMTRDSSFVFDSGEDSKAFFDWILKERQDLISWLNNPSHPDKQLKPGQRVADVSRHAVLLGIDAQLVGSVCHLLYRFFTEEACGPNMITRNAYALNHEIVRRIDRHAWGLLNIFLEANMGGDKKPSHEHYNGGHGKTVMAVGTLSHQHLRRYLNTTVQEIKRLGMDRLTWIQCERHAIICVYAGVRHCGRLSRHRPGLGNGGHIQHGSCDHSRNSRWRFVQPPIGWDRGGHCGRRHLIAPCTKLLKPFKVPRPGISPTPCANYCRRGPGVGGISIGIYGGSWQ